MIYLDNAATTRVLKEAALAMEPFLIEEYANPSGNYEFAKAAKRAVEDARNVIAGSIGAKSSEIYFTSGGTESDNWALVNAAENYNDKGKHIITSKIEHHAILKRLEKMEKKGFEVTYLDVDGNGVIDIEKLSNAIRKDTMLITIMFANNEIGTIEPVEKIGKIAKEKNVLFHTDGVQAYCHVPIDVNSLNIDMMSASSHKFNGPKGCGFLYVNGNVKLSPMIFGGSQERKMRAGTENVPGIIGMARAAQYHMDNMNSISYHTRKIRDYLGTRIMREIPYVKLNGSFQNRLPGNLNFCFRNVDGATLLVMLDEAKICASAGAACSFDSKTPSHVLKAIGLPDEIAYSALRITVDETTTKEEADRVVNTIKKSVFDLRS